MNTLGLVCSHKRRLVVSAGHKDLCTRKVVGYAMGERMTQNLVIESLLAACRSHTTASWSSPSLGQGQSVLLPRIQENT
jgi:hypothetical protein